jgi:Aminotransferase class-V
VHRPAGCFELQATTPLDPRVLDAMLPFWTDQYGNPHSRTHYFGWESDDAVEAARKQVQLTPVRCRLPSRAYPACRQHDGQCPGSLDVTAAPQFTGMPFVLGPDTSVHVLCQ